MKSFLLSLTLLCITTLFSTCKKKESVTPPAEPEPVAQPSPLPDVITLTVTNITDSTAICSASVVSEGASAIIAVGVCWDTLPNPTTLKNHTTNGAGTGSYSGKITGLTVSKTYHIRAYATNFNGTKYGQEIIFSTRNPKSWIKVNMPILNEYGLICMVSEGAKIYAGTAKGVIFSSDTGNTWVSIGLINESISGIWLKNNTIFVETNNSYYRSSDNGGTWVVLQSNFPYSVNQINAFSVGDNMLYAGNDSSFFQSSDNGDNWVPARIGLPATQYLSGYGLVGGVYRIAAKGKNVYAIVKGYNSYSVFYSANEGSSWQSTNLLDSWSSGIYGKGVDQIEFTTSSAFASKSTGINSNPINLISKDFITWNSISEIPQLNVHISCTESTVVCVAFGTNPNVTYSKDNGNTWTKLEDFGLHSSAYNRIYATQYYFWIANEMGIFKYRYN